MFQQSDNKTKPNELWQSYLFRFTCCDCLYLSNAFAIWQKFEKLISLSSCDSNVTAGLTFSRSADVERFSTIDNIFFRDSKRQLFYPKRIFLSLKKLHMICPSCLDLTAKPTIFFFTLEQKLRVNIFCSPKKPLLKLNSLIKNLPQRKK